MFRQWPAEKQNSRPKIISESSCQTLKRMLKKIYKSSLVDIMQESRISLSLSASSSTVLRELKCLVFHNRIAAHKPNITLQNGIVDCSGSRRTIIELWTCEKNVLWSDKSHFSNCESDECVFIWRMLNECFLKWLHCDYYHHTMILALLMEWWCFSLFGLCSLVLVVRSTNSKIHMDILDNISFPTLWQHFGKDPFFFQQDNCSIHTQNWYSHSLMKWIFKN